MEVSMEDRKNEKNGEVEIDLRRVLGALLKHAWIVGIVAVICAAISFAITLFFIKPEYQSTVMFYVNNSSLSIGDTSLDITTGDLSASRGLVKTYIIILKTRETLNDVIDYAGVDRTSGEISNMIEAEDVSSTEIFKVVVTSTDPQEAEDIASAITYILPKRINSIIEGTSARVVDQPIVPTSRSSPSYVQNTMLGFLLGFLLSVIVIMVRTVLDSTIRAEEDLTTSGEYPVLVDVPDMEHSGKGGYYYGYRKRAYDTTSANAASKNVLIGPDISFAASEAYKLLRTKLQFSFADEKACHIVGISSALPGEGKSLTAVNLAFSLSQLGKRVLLIDGDMRRPSIAGKLPISKSPGLSDFLSGQVSADNLIQLCGIAGDESAFHVISAGRVPPNPMELLSSKRMRRTLEQLRETYDYIILDLPPVGEVGDALAVAQLTDGMLMVARQHYGNRVAFSGAVSQFEFVNCKILGVVFNCTSEDAGGYGYGYYKSGYGSKYGKYYGYYRSESENKRSQKNS